MLVACQVIDAFLSARSERVALERPGCRTVTPGRHDRDVSAFSPSEAQPSLDDIEGDLLDEAFLTISPVVAGRDGTPRPGMVAGAELLPGRGLWTRLLSARRHGDFLFLRYRMNNR